MNNRKRPSCEDVLEAFACEAEDEILTLEKYLGEFPEYAEELIEFAAEITREITIRSEPLSHREYAMIERGWERHVNSVPKPIADPFSVMSGVELGKVAKLLNVPMQVLTAIRDRSVDVVSIPRRFLERLGNEIHCDMATLLSFLATPRILSVHRSRKSDHKPKSAERRTFEQVLIDAGVTEEDRKRLMMDN